MNTIYRGFEIQPCIIGGMHNGFKWVDRAGVEHGGFMDEDAAMNAVDAHKRAEAEIAAHG